MRCSSLPQRKVLINMLVPLLVGLIKRGFGHHLDVIPVVVSAEIKCSLNISQTGSVDELSKDFFLCSWLADGVLMPTAKLPKF